MWRMVDLVSRSCKILIETSGDAYMAGQGIVDLDVRTGLCLAAALILGLH